MGLVIGELRCMASFGLQEVVEGSRICVFWGFLSKLRGLRQVWSWGFKEICLLFDCLIPVIDEWQGS